MILPGTNNKSGSTNNMDAEVHKFVRSEHARGDAFPARDRNKRSHSVVAITSWGQ